MRVFGLHGLPGWVYALFSPAHRQFAVMDPLYCNQGIRQGREPFGNAFYGNDLEAFVLFEQKTLGREHFAGKFFKHPGNLAQQIPFPGIVKQGNRSGYLVVALPFVLDDVPADQVPYGLRPVRKVIFLYIFIQGFQQILFNRNSKTGNRHKFPFYGLKGKNTISASFFPIRWKK